MSRRLRNGPQLAAWAAIVLLTACSNSTTTTAPSPASAALANPKAPLALDTVEAVPLGGVHQRIYVRGAFRHLPVLLVVHGGPGEPGSQLALAWTWPLRNDYIVVHWDQRGSGGSQAPEVSDASVTAEQLQDDLDALVEHLCTRFRVKRLTLVGHDFGATLAIRAAAQNPDRFWSVVALNPVINGHAAESLTYGRLLRRAEAADDFRAVRALRSAGPPPWRDRPEARTTVRQWAAALGGELRGESSVQRLTDARRAAPHRYRLPDAQWRRGRERSEAQLRPAIIAVNLPQSVPTITVPVYFGLSRLDLVSPYELTERYYQQLDARRGKRLVWLDDAAHWPQVESPKQLQELLRGPVREHIQPIPGT